MANKNPKPKKTTEQFVADATAKHGDRYDYSCVKYAGNRIKVEIICREHGPFWQDPLNHINGSGCPACKRCKRTTLDDFLSRSRDAHGDRYDYSLVDYKTVDDKVRIICPEHGEFEQVAFDHMKGRGCNQCGIEKWKNSKRHTAEQFIADAVAFHGNRYDYSRVVYNNVSTKVEIVCKEHGPFWQIPFDHKTRYGCPACSGLAPISREEFIARAVTVHGDRYDYSECEYTAYSEPASIACRVHGEFWQAPKSHALGAGCPKCAREQTSSKAETEIADWLQKAGVSIIRNDRDALDGMELDIYIPSHQVGIEYNGSYWHNDEAMQHPRIHEVKAKRAAGKGIRIVTVWDFDWETKRELVQRHILHTIGANTGQKTHARKCAVDTVSFDRARDFYEANHIQGAPWRAMEHLGLFFGGELVACMSFGQGNSRRGKTGDDEWELARFATSGIVRGGASRLFSEFIRRHDPKAIWSFSDRQHFSGGLYPALGFAKDGEVPADYRVVHQGRGKVWHKSAWKRQNIPARLVELGIAEQYDPETDQRTEREMQALARTVRIMDAGKVRWKWAKENAPEGALLVAAE